MNGGPACRYVLISVIPEGPNETRRTISPFSFSTICSRMWPLSSEIDRVLSPMNPEPQSWPCMTRLPFSSNTQTLQKTEPNSNHECRTIGGEFTVSVSVETDLTGPRKPLLSASLNFL